MYSFFQWVFDVSTDHSKLTLPVLVLISHRPPTASPMGAFGSSTLPVLVRTANEVPDGSLPPTDPVLVFTRISGDTQSVKRTFPVLRFTEMLSSATKPASEREPVFPFEAKL